MAKTLTVSKIQSLKATGKDYRLADSGGLHLKVTAKGTKSWQFRYKNTWIGIGGYPSISLKQAREEATKYKQLIASGKDPKIEKEKAIYQDDKLFSVVADKAFDMKRPNKPNGWKSEKNYKANYSVYTRLILPKFKNININDIEPFQIAKILEKNTPSNQRKLKLILNMIFNYAVGKGICKYNATFGLQLDKENSKGYDFINPIEDKYNFSQLLNDIENYKGQYTTRMALKFATLVGFRPSNIVELRWEDIQETIIDGKVIPFAFISSENMKMSRDFRQPLSKQAYEILEEVRQYNGNYKYVFHSTNTKNKHITIDCLSKALKDTLGYDGIDKPKQVTHGFRKSVRTYLSSISSKYRWSNDSIRMILSHTKENKIDQIYDKNDYLLERSQMLQLWADYVDEVKESSNIIKLG
ncbi:phage integrase family protein [Francisella philomiragia subsp. philomiragia ATCC 25015]|uniref:tyrosine-type recombinase/integrase n=1 Tax=Francisella philomiragia TaxID=28110 RepID=UPI0001AF7945|nr:integrase arm-type DNA-binding domain-containing protein [Francisella philomiragia]AJI75208.1 phage integrase family protein [Francisella philomiragia subsp. philomiragia ATCC 25015]EET20236.1 phage integrase [Francisella philomiragia subsp. philomiragia ATCC 25015]MBK2237280.1 integrase arm-type DNA-binding domain-containing protein [Francisella philomiragia]